MKSLRDRVEDRIRDTICRACIYEQPGGACSLEAGGADCPIIARIDRIIDIVRSTNAKTIDPYVDRLRENICAECREQAPDGRCILRERAECALDDYFVLLVDLVEQELSAEP
jgi:hypothetical protein